MTKKQIIDNLVMRTDLTTSQAIHAVEGIIEIVADALVDDDPIFLRGFAAIKTVRRAAKTARNIRTGETVNVPARRQVKFIAYNELQKRINRADNITQS